jgi:hypothetical protein
MARPSDSSSTTRLAPTFRTSSSDPAPQKHSTSGRVAFDDRGNAIWELRTAEHRYSREGSTTLVRKLKETPLSIEATGIIRKQAAPPGSKPLPVPAPKRAVPTDAGQVNHYDRAKMGTVRTFPVRTSAATGRAAPRIAKTSQSRPGLLGRLFGRKA